MSIRFAPLDQHASPAIFRDIAEIHQAEIPNGFLASLGTPTLQKLYKQMAGCPAAFCVAALEAERCVGFIWGSSDTSAVYRYCLPRCAGSLALPLAARVLRPTMLFRVWETLRYPSTQSESHELPRAEILNFCVRGDQQGRGVGQRLFQALCEGFQRRNVPSFRIVTGEEQTTAHRFYEAAGAVKHSQIQVHKGVASRVYLYQPSTLQTVSAA
ncbi:GNAT family N-acetyltransferase [Roseimaritima sediminicola]|uniref:GNAT family N-acetyltransferase n=1 Tax=Roseimaritima sediminicola TaxID=2662066 RepID=UPI001298506B|nr:GNAT family N-acetyltransferase [Roseimaritima sediminicola]